MKYLSINTMLATIFGNSQAGSQFAFKFFTIPKLRFFDFYLDIENISYFCILVLRYFQHYVAYLIKTVSKLLQEIIKTVLFLECLAFFLPKRLNIHWILGFILFIFYFHPLYVVVSSHSLFLNTLFILFSASVLLFIYIVFVNKSFCKIHPFM